MNTPSPTTPSTPIHTPRPAGSPPPVQRNARPTIGLNNVQARAHQGQQRAVPYMPLDVASDGQINLSQRTHLPSSNPFETPVHNRSRVTNANHAAARALQAAQPQQPQQAAAHFPSPFNLGEAALVDPQQPAPSIPERLPSTENRSASSGTPVARPLPTTVLPPRNES